MLDWSTLFDLGLRRKWRLPPWLGLNGLGGCALEGRTSVALWFSLVKTFGLTFWLRFGGTTLEEGTGLTTTSGLTLWLILGGSTLLVSAGGRTASTIVFAFVSTAGLTLWLSLGCSALVSTGERTASTIGFALVTTSGSTTSLRRDFKSFFFNFNSTMLNLMFHI